jgi:hypothetical protein
LDCTFIKGELKGNLDAAVFSSNSISNSILKPEK